MAQSKLTQQQQVIFRDFRLVTDEYRRKKEETEQRLKQEKGVAEDAWKHAQYLANAETEQVVQLMRSTQDDINKTEWQNRVSGGTPQALLLAAPTGSASAPQTPMDRCRATAFQAREQILAFLRSNEKPSSVTKKMAWLAVLITVLSFVFCSIISGASHSGVLGLLALIVPIIAGIATLVFFPSQRKGKIKNSYATLLQAVTEAENLRRQKLKAPEEVYQRQLAGSEMRHQDTIRQLDQSLAQDMSQKLRPSFTNFMTSAYTTDPTCLGAAWDDRSWGEWQPLKATSSVTRLGTLTADVRQLSLPPQITQLPSVPAFIACPGNQNLLFKTQGAGKDQASFIIQALMLRLLANQPPGKVHFTLIDPVGLGQNVAAFMQLADHDEALVTSKAWTEPKHIEQRLADLSEQMETVIQKYLRNQYSTIEEYNEKAGEVAEPYRVLIVIGFPVKFSQEAARRLVEISTNGPRCGVSTMVILDTEQALPYDFNLPDLERVSTVMVWDGSNFVWQNEDFERCRLNFDTPPKLELFNHIIKNIGENAKSASEVKVRFERVAPDEKDWWTGNTSAGISVPLGRIGASRLQELKLGEGTSQHALVVGKTGSGKTTLLHVLIANLALMYSPDEMELYLVDFKEVGFTPYATYTLPHARVIAIQSEREFGLSVLQGLDAELERRKNLLSKAGVQNIKDYRALPSSERLPRILLMVDEFQEFFTQDDEVARGAGLLLDRLVRQGRAFGMHVMLGSQTLSGAYNPARATISQMAVRIAMQCEEADSRLVLSDDNPAARLLSRPGEAIYNAANGMVSGNNTFQCAWLPDEELDGMLARIQKFAQQRQYRPPKPQIIFNGSEPADATKNLLFNGVVVAPSWPAPQQAVPVWLGDPIAIKEPTAVRFRAQASSNLLIVGQQDEVALGMQIFSLLSLAAQHTPQTARFYVLDFSPVDAPYAGIFERVGKLLPHTVKVANRRELASVIAEIAEEVQNRLDTEAGGAQSIYLFVYGLQRARDLRQDEDMGFSSFSSEPLPPNPAKQFATILREGSDLKVHTLIWCDTLTNLNRTLDRRALREFDMRVVFQMSADDSMNLVESPVANKIDQYRALLYSEEMGNLEKFRPYGLPSEAWLQQVANRIQQKR